jgi:hypothetical protein
MALPDKIIVDISGMKFDLENYNITRPKVAYMSKVNFTEDVAA